MRFQSKIEALQDFDGGMIALGAVKGFEAEVVKMNTDRLYDVGEYTTGRAITPGYTPFTVKLKRQKGQPTDRVTLRDTGDFHSSIYLVFQGDRFLVAADDPKTADLVAKYGTQIFGMTDKDMAELIELIRPMVFEKFKEAAYA